MKRYHPATFSDGILEFVVKKRLVPHGLILDPFAGVGRVHQLGHDLRFTVGVEIEMPWASARRSTIQGNAKHLPFRKDVFDGAFTSPVYGNRMSDSHNARDGSLRRSYTHDLRRTTGDDALTLHPDNAGHLYAWQDAYWSFHELAWREVYRVLKPRARFILNVSDCVRNKKVYPVVSLHRQLCQKLGFNVIQGYEVPTRRMKFGENAGARVGTEAIIVFTK